MLRKLIKTGLLIVQATVVVMPTVAEAGRKHRPTRKQLAEKQLRDYYLKLDQRLFGEKDYKSAERLLKKSADDGTMRPLVVSLLAQYHRRMERDAVAGLRVLAPEVLGKDAARQWLRDLKNAESKRDAKYSDAVRQAHFKRQPKPEEPSGIALPFPHTQMKISESNVDCALEVARCLMDLGHIQQALQVIDTQGKAFENEGRVLSFECLGDLLLKMQMFEKSVKSYQNGLKLLQHLKPTEGFDAWQKLILARLQKKLAQAKRLWDMDRYGAGYIAYRDAEIKRRKQKSYAEAILLYDGIIEKYPKTVYSEAAKCYRIKCLLELAKSKSLPRAARAAIQKLEKRLEEERKFIRLAKRHKVPEQTIEEFEARASKIEAGVAELEAISLGKKAWDVARTDARAFVDNNKFWLYRGELLLDLGYFALCNERDIDKGMEYLSVLTKWCQLAPKYDSLLANFGVPQKAQDISRPPKDMKYRDDWGNVKWSQPAIGAIVNRRTAPWILAKLGSEAHELLGFCKMLDGDCEGAAKEAEMVLKYDPYERRLEQKNMPNTYRRLKKAYARGYLISSDDTLRNVSKEISLSLRIADFHFEREDWQAAEQSYGEVYRASIDRLPPRAGAYVTNMYAKSLEMQAQVSKALTVLSDFDKKKELKNTPSWAPAKFNQAHLTALKDYPKAVGILETVARNATKKQTRMLAQFRLGALHLSHRKHAESLAAFELFIAKYGKASPELAGYARQFNTLNQKALSAESQKEGTQ